MATFLFASNPLYGHVAPMLTAGRHGVSAGHRVIMLTGSRFADNARDAGMDFVPLTGRADFDERDLDGYLPDLHRHTGVALSQYQLQHTFIHPIPDQWAGVRSILADDDVDVVAVDHLFAGIVPLLTRPRAERPPVAAFGIGPLAQISRDTAPAGMALSPSWSPQGLVQAFAVYVDTLFVCSATGFLILSTGAYRVFEGESESGAVIAEGGVLPADAEVGPTFVQTGFDTLWSGAGSSFVAVSLLFFCLTTIIAYYYMAETNLRFLMGKASTIYVRPLRSTLGSNATLLLQA